MRKTRKRRIEGITVVNDLHHIEVADGKLAYPDEILQRTRYLNTPCCDLSPRRFPHSQQSR